MRALSTRELGEAPGTPRSASRPKRRVGAARVMGAALVLGTIAMTAATVNATDEKRKKSAQASNRATSKDGKNREVAAAPELMQNHQPANADTIEPENTIEAPCSQPASNPEQLTSFEKTTTLSIMAEFSTTLDYCAPIANEIDQTTKLMLASCEPAEVYENVTPAIAAEEPHPALEEACQKIVVASGVAKDESADRERETSLNTLMRIWNWIQQQFSTQRTKKRLRVCETVSLGEKRFVAVIQVDGEQFLVGGSSNSVSTLARLERKDFADVYRVCEQDLSRA